MSYQCLIDSNYIKMLNGTLKRIGELTVLANIMVQDIVDSIPKDEPIKKKRGRPVGSKNKPKGKTK